MNFYIQGHLIKQTSSLHQKITQHSISQADKPGSDPPSPGLFIVKGIFSDRNHHASQCSQAQSWKFTQAQKSGLSWEGNSPGVWCWDQTTKLHSIMCPLLCQAVPVPLSSCSAEGQGEGKWNHTVFLRDRKETLKEKAQEQKDFHRGVLERQRGSTQSGSKAREEGGREERK